MTTTTTTSSDIFQRLHPRVYLERFLAEDVRPDGRPFNVARDVAVNVGVSATSAYFYAAPVFFSQPQNNRLNINSRRLRPRQAG